MYLFSRYMFHVKQNYNGAKPANFTPLNLAALFKKVLL